MATSSSSTPLLIGAHVSAQGGIFTAPARAQAIGANVVQVFCSSPQMWSKVHVPQEKLDMYNENAKTHGILASVIHAQYLVNLASENPELIAKSRLSLSVDMQAAGGMSATGVVVHVGSHAGRGWERCKEQVAKEIAHILEESSDESVFLIENASGMTGKIGSDLHEVAWLIDTLKAGKRLGWCVDTCHAFSAGYSLVPAADEKYLLDTMDELNLTETLKVVHVNDSRDDYRSHKDRHANIGEGKIPTADSKNFLNDARIRHLPLVLETPGPEKKGPAAIDISTLQHLFET